MAEKVEYKVFVHFSLNEEDMGIESYYVYADDDLDDESIVDALMDATREVLADEFKDNEQWQDGEYIWTLREWEKLYFDIN